MFLKPSSRLMLMLMWMVVTTGPGKSYSVTLQNMANVSYATKNLSPSTSASLFSPRMDFDQWKPLIGRGDPLRNDPTYDYEPPVLERVRYWADESRIEREHYPERKSEVLMLGITSRKPSVSPQLSLSPLPPRRQRLPPSPNYEDLTYKISEYYPMTILVPPPPSPPGHKPLLFILSEEKIPSPYAHGKQSVSTKFYPKTTTPVLVHHSSSYDIKESNLIYQSSTTIENWATDPKQTNSVANSAVSSEYAGWGPTTPIDEIDTANDTFNSIFYDYKDLSKPYSVYKPMPSDSPSPVTSKPFLPTILPTFTLPTYTTPLTTQHDIDDILKTTTSIESSSTELPTSYFNDVKISTEQYEIQVDHSSNLPTLNNTEQTIEDMMGPMMSMPLGNGPERPQDNLYAHATNNLHIFKEYQSEDAIELENMQTMQPPPVKSTERTPISHDQSYDLPPHILSTLLHNSPVAHALDPYLHMRFTTPTFENSKSTTEAPVVPMYLIIQGHSKVKTYGSKPPTTVGNEMMSNETQKLNVTDEVKHLHPIKDKKIKKLDNSEIKRKSRTHNLISLVDSGLGSIEIQEADVGIKYDVSDGSKVPVEIYRKGIVDSEINNNFLLKKKQFAKERNKRQISIEDLIPFDEDSLEEYVYNFLEERRNDTGVTGLIAQAVTSDAAAAVDELENDDDDER